ncbi:hypothetical protein YSY43_17650 [Paenibacillus sp. YSY-4.3]
MLSSIMRKASFALLSLTLVSGIASSHGYASSEAGKPVIEWSRQYGVDEKVTGQNITSTSDGGYVVTGTVIEKESGIRKANILKLNSSGTLQWEQKIQHNNTSRTEVDVTIETKDGGYLSCGSILKENGKYDILLIKLNAQGAVEWMKEYNYGFTMYSLSVAETKDNDFVITGRSYGGADINYAYVLKINAQGQELWLKKLKFSYDQDFEDIIATPDGGSIAVGSQVDRFFNDPNRGAVISKLNADGEEVWTRKLSAAPKLRTAYSIAPSDDGYVIFGEDSDWEDAYFLTKIDTNGKVLWEKKFKLPIDRRYFKKVVRTNEGYTLLAEIDKNSHNDKERRYELSKFDNHGELLNQNEFTVKDFSEMTGLTASSDGGYALLGQVSDIKSYCMQVTKLAGPNSQPGERMLERISFTDNGKKMAVGEHTPTAVIAHYSDGSKETLKDSLSFSSDDEEIANVDFKGIIKGIKAGSTTIHAFYQNHQAQLEVEVFEVPNHGDADHWSYQYGIDHSYIYVRSIVPASDGGYIITGDMRYEMYGIRDAYVLKLNASGIIEWQQVIRHGLSGHAEAHKAIETKDGGILISGTTSNHDYSRNTRDVVFMAKLSAQGILEWEKEFPGVDRAGNAVDETDDGGFVVTGANPEDGPAYVLKTDSQGQVMWNRTYSFGYYQNYNDILATPDGGSIAVGVVDTYEGNNDEAIVTKLNPNGDVVWNKNLLPIGRSAYSIISTDEGDYLIASNTKGGVNYLTRINDGGEVIWERTYEAQKDQEFYKIVRDSQGYVLLGRNAAGGYANSESQFVALELGRDGQIIGKHNFNEPNLTGLYHGTVTPDGKFVLTGTVEVNGKSILQVTKTAGSGNPPVDPVLDGISFKDSSVKIAAGEKKAVLVKTHYSDGTEQLLTDTDSISFFSEDENTATVDAKGLITGVNPGSTVIQAVYQNQSAQLQVEVTMPGSENPEPVEGIFYLDSEEYSLTEGTSIDTVAFFKDKDGNIHNVTKMSTFKSDNPAIVDYDQDGNINGVRAGITYITAEYQGKTYRALVQVVRASVPK